MKFLRYLCASAVIISASVFAQKIDPITQAVLNGYGELLKENPRDCETLYERASQYYQLGMLDEAKADIKTALEYTPKKDTDMRQRELSLFAAVASATKDYEAALTAINDAIALKPDDYYNIYRKGNILLALNRPEEAYRTFSSLQSLKSRSQEAYFGMAKACIAQNNYSEAQTLMKEIENADPTNPTTYVRLGDLYQAMNQPENASANYIVSITMGGATAAPMQALNQMAQSNYKAVEAALDFAAEKSDNKAMILFLKGNVALDSGHYAEAEDAINSLLKLPEGKLASAYSVLAAARYAQGDLPGATEAINQAITTSPTVDNYLLKSRIQLTNGNFHGATVDANEASRIDPNAVEPYILTGEAYALAGQGDDAISSLNKAIISEPDNLEALLMRAYTYQEVAKNPKQALIDFNRILLENPESFPGIAIKGIAQSKAGKKMDADALVSNALSNAPSADDLYWGAVYYAQTGDLERAKTLADEASYKGFRNTMLLQKSNTPWLNLSPIRHLLK